MILYQAEKHFGNGPAEIIKYYNEHVKYFAKTGNMPANAAWCAIFCCVIAHKCGLTVDQFPYSVRCSEMVKRAKELGIFFDDPKLTEPGDLVFFDWDKNGDPNHVGFVDKDYETTAILGSIEGNFKKTNQVGYRKYSPEFIIGFASIRPNSFV